MAGFDLPVRAIREQIASALHLILQVTRMPDGRRVITSLTEVQGMEGDIILLQDIFHYELSQAGDGTTTGQLAATGLRPRFLDKIAEHGIEVPASTFKSSKRSAAGPKSAGAAARRRSMKVPTPAEIAERERLR